MSKDKCHLWRHTFKNNFLQWRCSNVLLHLENRLLLCEPKIEFKNLPAGKAPATDHRDLFSITLTIFKDIMETYRSEDYRTTASTLYGREKKGKVTWSYLNSHSQCRVLFADNVLFFALTCAEVVKQWSPGSEQWQNSFNVFLRSAPRWTRQQMFH